jgi:hypothetical protein
MEVRMRVDRSKVFAAVFSFFVALASASYAHAASFTIGGTVSGLSTGASVTLADNATDTLKVTANGKFTFAKAVATGAAYSVTVKVQPTGETCTVTAGSGTVGTANVTAVKVTCKASTYTIGGTLSGLITGRSITLLNNGTNALKVSANGAFTFTKALATKAAYAVTISVQPAGETCAVTAGSGTVGTANVKTVKVACKANTYTIGGTVSGLSTGASVTLLDNGTGALKVAANGKFTFAKAIASGATYAVTVSVQPTGETCTVTKGTGTVLSTNVTTVVVTCKATTTTTYSIGGTVSGLSSGASVTLLDNGSGALKVTSNGAFTFATKLASGATYNVTVSVQPTGETCTVTGGSGTVGTANVTTVKVACAAAATFTIGGTVSGLASSTSVTLLDNGTGALVVTANGAFTFATKLASGATYNVTVSVQPTGETCTVTGGSGTVSTANVTTVKVACAAAATFTIGGTVSGLASSTSMTLLDNGTDSLVVSANGKFTFATALATGASYSVTVSAQPTGQSCTVTGGSGTVGTANVTTVKVACTTTSGGGGSGSYWIPYSATPAPIVTPVGSNGLFLIPSDKLSSSPAPTWVTTDTTQLLGIGTQITEKSGAVTYSPQIMMYADTNSAGVTKIFGLTLAGTSSIPTPTQISNLSLSKSQQICQVGSNSETDVTQPTTLFVLIQVGTATQCLSGGSTYEVVHYADSATTAPLVVNVNTTEFDSVYQNGKLSALLLFNSATQSLDVYADDTFTSPTQKITGLSSANQEASVLEEGTLSTSGLFYGVTTTASATELYRIDGASLAATLIQNETTSSFGNFVQDDNNLYYIVVTPGASSTSTATINQVALSGGTPKLLYTSPSFSSTTGFMEYLLIGGNDSVVAFEFYSPGADDTKSTAALYSVPVGKTTATPTTIASYPAGSFIPEAFLAAPSGDGLSSSILFATVRKDTGTATAPVYAYSAVSFPLNGGAGPGPIANSVYLPLSVITSRLTDNVFQVTGITDTNGGYGGGTANTVNVSNLTDTPFTTTGGGHFVFSPGFNGFIEAISSNNIAIGFFDNQPATNSGQATIPQINGAAADLSSNFLYQIVVQNTLVTPY